MLPESLLMAGAPLLEETLMKGGSFDERARKGLSVLMLIFIIPLIPAVYCLLRFVYRQTLGRSAKRTIIEDMRIDAARHEKAGEFVSAAVIYESRLKDYEKAALLYEKGRDFEKAALLYDSLGMIDKTKAVFLRAGLPEKAAEVDIRLGDYEGAARLYEQAGNKLDAAFALERAGRRLAAVKAYREAGQYIKASELLKEEGKLLEAAQMFGISLTEKKPEKSTLEDYYTYAVMLDEAGETKKAKEVFESIAGIEPSFRDAGERLSKYEGAAVKAPGAGETFPEEETHMEGMTSLRNIMKGGGTEPRYAMRLWVQALKALQQAYAEGRGHCLISPENIFIDSDNNIRFGDGRPAPVYLSPEAAMGIEPDEKSDIYSMGVILYEMLAGGLGHFGLKRARDIARDVPEWLDELVLRCVKKSREDRYGSIEEVFADLKKLSRAR
jgi:tetratricopeptide (TPR) repeat protein